MASVLRSSYVLRVLRSGRALGFLGLIGSMGVVLAASGQSKGEAQAQVIQTGTLSCTVRLNDEPAKGTMAVLRGTQVVETFKCDGRSIQITAGTYRYVIRIDGLLNPLKSRDHSLNVPPGGSMTVEQEVPAGSLRVDGRVDGQPVRGMVAVVREGRRVGSVATGTPSHLTRGTYEIVVNYRGQERRFPDTTIDPDTPVRLQVDFRRR